MSRISPPDLNSLMALLEVEVVALSECLVNAGCRLELGGHPAPGIHYILQGSGRMSLRGGASFAFAPHTLVVVPPDCPLTMACAHAEGTHDAIEGAQPSRLVDSVRRFRAGDEAEPPQAVMICGFFKAHYGAATGLFETLAAPIVEQFAPRDRLDDKLRSAFDELLAQEVGAGAMSAALLKQVLVTLLRRSLTSIESWVDRFAMLSDPAVARAFAAMVAHPGAAHTIESLADCAFLSRSAFMARFSQVVGRSPMAVLRDLRMRQAAAQLSAGARIDAVVRNAGYASRSSFVRTFRQVHGVDPGGWREAQSGSG